MYDIEKLSRWLTFDQYQIGKELFTAMKDAKYTSSKAAAMCYRAGYLAANRDRRERKKALYSERQPEAETISLPKAIILEEGDTTNEQ